MAIDDDEQMKARIKWMWSLGDYAELATLLEPAADALVAACGVAPGMEVLDVAAGTGNRPHYSMTRVATSLSGAKYDCT